MANYTNELMASRFSEVMWLIEQIMWKSLDKRVSGVSAGGVSHRGDRGTEAHPRDHRQPPGSHREVITRMLRYFQSEGMIKLSRGAVRILDPVRLEEFCGEPSPAHGGEMAWLSANLPSEDGE